VSRFDGLGQLTAAPTDINVISKGASSIFNPERALHMQTVKLTIKNNDAANPANLVLSAGDHGAAFASKLIADGTNNTTNDNGDTVSVTVTSDFGIDAVRATIAQFQNLIKNKGVVVANTRLRYNDSNQVGYKLKFQRYDYLGDDKVDQLDPEVYYNPSQYNDKVIDMPLKVVLDRDTIVHYTLLAGETVTFSFAVAAIQDMTAILRDYAKRSAGSTLL